MQRSLSQWRARVSGEPLTVRRRRSSALQFHRPANELTSAKRKSPWIMRGARDTDSRIGHNMSDRICVAREAMARIGRRDPSHDFAR